MMIVVPYFWAVERHQPGFLRYFLVNENLMRFLVSDYGDKYGAGRETFRGMAAVWALVVTLPWSLVFVFRRASDWRRTRPTRSFPLLSVIVITLFWCLTSRVPISYLLPAVLATPKKMAGRSVGPKISDHYFSYEFYHGPWGEGAPGR